MEATKELSIVENNLPQQQGGVFSSIENFEKAQRMVKLLASSQLIPKAFQGRIDDCCIALEMAQRIGASPMAVLQNLYVVHGKPAWSSQFLISSINASGKFSPLRYKMTGKKGTPSFGCIAWAVDRSGEKLEGPEVSIEMAETEGWTTRKTRTGEEMISKWKTMPELMLRYRAATFFARTYCPELTMGISTQDEIIDVSPVVTEARPSIFERAKTDEVEQPEVVAVHEPDQETPQPVKNIFETETELNVETWLHDNEPGVKVGQVKAFCSRGGIEFGDYLLSNEAKGLKDICKSIKGE